MPERETVISWEDPQRIDVDVRSRPIVTPLGGKPQELTWLGGQIYFADRTEWFEHMLPWPRRSGITNRNRLTCG